MRWNQRNWHRQDGRPAPEAHRVSGQEIADLLARVAANKDLGDYDKGFVSSLTQQFKKRKSLSEKQASALKSIDEKAKLRSQGIDPQAKILARLDAVLAETRNEWEKGFCKSLRGQALSRALSARQTEIFETIEIKYSAEAKAIQTAWEKTFDADMRRNWQVVTDYYRRTGTYYTKSVAAAKDPKYTPTKDEYERVCANKYALRVIAAVTDPPRFAKGSWAVIRKTAPNRRSFMLRHLAGARVLIIDNDNTKILNAAKGAKVYRVLPVGSGTVIEIEERWLKHAPKK